MMRYIGSREIDYNSIVVSRIIEFLKKRPFGVVLGGILTVISVGMIKPDFYLVGWDNYSSYFNIENSFFRTLFATWREYRGLGVVSDAEVTDVFRIFVQYILHFFVKEQLLDQIYFVLALWVGVLSMYGLARALLSEFVKKKNWIVDMGAGVAGFFYLFNLNTLSVFYSPMIPFVNRFWGLPALILGVINFDKKRSKKNLAWLLLIVFFSSGSYITPTVMITNLIALFVFGVFYFGVKKTLVYEAVFVLLNAFWLMPFVNYVINKSSIVPLARTFVEINESMLNKPESFFSLNRQAILWPSFLDMEFLSINREAYTIHPLLNNFLGGISRQTLFVFPVLVGLGGLLLIFNIKKYKKLGWLWFFVIFFLFLSVGEHGFLGKGYGFLAKNIPFFEMIFRIGDTKFHSYMAVAGSLICGFLVCKLVEMTRIEWLKRVMFLCLIICFGWYGFQFRSYANNMVGFFAYTKIPAEYMEMAKIVNDDKTEGRLLHLPMAWGHQYWKSYSWGYLGSAWFDFLIDRPFIDKTFEPASMENSYLNSKINELLDSFSNVDYQNKENIARNFLELLNKAGIKYVMVDGTINSSVYARNIYYNSKQYVSRADMMMKYLADRGWISRQTSFDINFDNFFDDYEKLYPVSKTGFPEKMPKEVRIDLYKMGGTIPMFQPITQAENIDGNFDNLSETDLIFGKTNLVQSGDKGTIIPFFRQNHQVAINTDSVDFDYQISADRSKYRIEMLGEKDRIMVDVFVRSEDKTLIVSLFDRYMPDINGKEYRQLIGEYKFEAGDSIEGYKLKIGDIVLGLPSENFSETRYVDSVMVDTKDFKIKLLKLEESREVDLMGFERNAPLTCFGPQLANYEGGVDIQNSNIKIVSRYGGACVTGGFISNKEESPKYVEIKFRMKAISDGIQGKRAYVCVYEGEGKTCLNDHRHFNLNEEWTDYVIGLDEEITELDLLKFEFGTIPGGKDSLDMDYSGMNVNYYKDIGEEVVSYEPSQKLEIVELEKELKLSIPKAKSDYSFYKNEKDAYIIPQEMCPNGMPRNVTYEGDKTVAKVDGCSIYFAYPFLYKTSSPYLMAFEYKISEGQQPNIVIGQNGDDFLVERVSLYQGYPNISRDEWLTASRLISADFRSGVAIKETTAHVFQDTEGRGELSMGNFVMMEYPKLWYGMRFIPANANNQYIEAKIDFTKQILPSLWKVRVSSEKEGKVLIRFGQGYDRQWGVYENLSQAVMAKSQAKNYRCDGWANCFEINTDKRTTKDYWIFYWPETLAMIGWIVSLSASLTLVFLTKSKKIASK